MALWSFISRQSQTFPVLQALSAQLGGVCREELNKLYLDTKDVRDPKFFDKVCQNSKSRDQLWSQAHRSRRLLLDLGPMDETLGPWSSVGEATAFAFGVLGAYNMKENLEWKKDAEF